MKTPASRGHKASEEKGKTRVVEGVKWRSDGKKWIRVNKKKTSPRGLQDDKVEDFIIKIKKIFEDVKELDNKINDLSYEIDALAAGEKLTIEDIEHEDDRITYSISNIQDQLESVIYEMEMEQKQDKELRGVLY